jgi:hypothetical protein
LKAVAVAVIVTWPTPAVPWVALQLMMLASQMPPQIRPPVETVAIFALLLVKVMSAATVVPLAFKAMAES